jgi:hypothetical protein
VSREFLEVDAKPGGITSLGEAAWHPIFRRREPEEKGRKEFG